MCKPSSRRLTSTYIRRIVSNFYVSHKSLPTLCKISRYINFPNKHHHIVIVKRPAEFREAILTSRSILSSFNILQTQIIRYNGYPAEEYSVVTDDGYIIYIQRIPSGRNQDPSSGPKPVIFLQHGLLCSSSNWVTNLPNEGFAFILADAGFDVWLGNVRGNTYGLRHVKYPVHSDEFWNFRSDSCPLFNLCRVS